MKCLEFKNIPDLSRNCPDSLGQRNPDVKSGYNYCVILKDGRVKVGASGRPSQRIIDQFGYPEIGVRKIVIGARRLDFKKIERRLIDNLKIFLWSDEENFQRPREIFSLDETLSESVVSCFRSNFSESSFKKIEEIVDRAWESSSETKPS